MLEKIPKPPEVPSVCIFHRWRAAEMSSSLFILRLFPHSLSSPLAFDVYSRCGMRPPGRLLRISATLLSLITSIRGTRCQFAPPPPAWPRHSPCGQRADHRLLESFLAMCSDHLSSCFFLPALGSTLLPAFLPLCRPLK